jgi:hypothetical protein
MPTVPNTTVLESALVVNVGVPDRERDGMIPYLDIFRIESNGVLWCGDNR